MIPESHDCVACGARYFPARLRCHRCGSTSFMRRAVPDGVVGPFTTAARIPEGCPFTCLAEVHCEGDLTLIAGAASVPRTGERVALRQAADGAIRIATHD